MLFHVKHIHTFETCPAGHGPEMVSGTFVTIARPEYAKEVGVKVLGMYADAPAHVAYFILDARRNSPPRSIGVWTEELNSSPKM